MESYDIWCIESSCLYRRQIHEMLKCVCDAGIGRGLFSQGRRIRPRQGDLEELLDRLLIINYSDIVEFLEGFTDPGGWSNEQTLERPPDHLYVSHVM